MCRWTTQSIQREREEGGGEGSVDPRRRGGEARSDGKRADSFMAGQMERFERAVSHECESLAMRVVWKRKSSGDRDDSLFEARSPDVPSFSGIPQDVHVCPTPVEGSASCRHRASKDRRKLCANRAQVSSRPEGCPCSRWNFVDEFGDETGDLEREGIVEEIVVTGNFKNCSSYGIVNFLSLESRISEF